MKRADVPPSQATEAQRKRRRQEKSSVALLECPSYEEDLLKLLKASLPGLKLPNLSGKTVVLKPNMVEFRPDRPVTTHPAVVTAAIELADYLGAADIIVAEGPGHFRDTEFLLEATGIGAVCAKSGVRFVDLNLDKIEKIENKDGFTRLKHFYLPETILSAGAVISLPKLKTHHWVGMTASMKNLFGTVPGQKYGWPKNVLHWIGITATILDLQHLVRPTFALVDAIVSMEGDGPINGRGRKSGFVVLGEDLAAVDATCARSLAIEPAHIGYLKLAGEAVGNIEKSQIELIGSPVETVSYECLLPSTFRNIRQAKAGDLRGISGV